MDEASDCPSKVSGSVGIGLQLIADFHPTMRSALLPCVAAALSCCWQAEPALEAEARAELSRMFVEVADDSTKLRNVRPVKDSVCGEVSIKAKGRPPVFRLFTYRPDKDAAIDLLPQPQLTADGAQCPVRDDILAICAPTASEREQAELRIARCRLSTPL